MNESQKKEYDYNGPIETTSVELAKMILAEVDKVKDAVIIENFEKATPEKRQAFAESSTDMAIAVMHQISLSDIPYPYATRCVDKLIYVLTALKQHIDGRANQALDEFTSRHLGTRDPESNKFSKEECTLGQLFLKLDETIKATGNNKYDWYDEPVVKNDDGSDATGEGGVKA